MKISALDAKHECYDAELYTKYDALYKGGKAFRKVIECFLTKNTFEDGETYRRRCSEACYEPYVNVLVNQFAAQLFSFPFEIKNNEGYSDDVYINFKENCDFNGTDLVSYIKERFTKSITLKRAWTIINRPDIEEGLDLENLSLQEYEESRLGDCWLTEVDTEQVYDWEYDDNFKQLLWVIIHDLKHKRATPFDDRKTVTETWKIYDTTSITTYGISYREGQRPNPETELQPIRVVSHNFPRVPVKCLEVPEGLWLLNHLADAAIEHFRMDNALGWAMRRACYPIWVWNSDSTSDSEGILQISNCGFGVKIGQDEKFAPQSPSHDPFTSIQNRINDKKDEIHRLALQMALAIKNTASAIRRSGESKAQDVQATEIILHSYAAIVKEHVEEIYELISDARGQVEKTFSIEGMEQFIVDDSESIFRTASMAQTFPILMKSETFQRELGAKLSSVLLPNLSQEVKEQINSEFLKVSIAEIQPVLPSVDKTTQVSERTKPLM